ncbi:MAG: antibiotic biosynthesis monooxygenase [Anaerolineae bacterium]|nr:antibiotic biosynthesis monooxygenase [Anaerolineae bacterium]
MIARVWRGWTTPENADAYEELLREYILPGIHRVTGFHGAYVLRQDGESETAFVVMTLFESLEAVRGFAGDTYTTPVIEPEARVLLSRFEEVANHYEIKVSPD